MSSAVGSSAVGPSFFYEDQVYRIGKNGEVEFGLVTENWQMYSSDEEDEDEGPSDKVPHGHVAVTWFPKNKDEVVLESKVKLSDRALMPGDVVRRLIAGKDAQCGYCRSVQVLADVQVMGSKKIIPGVLANNLPPVQKLQPDIAIYLNSWIGVIRDVKYLLTLKFNDNSVCVVDSEAVEDRFQDVRRNIDVYDGGDGIFYPGQKLRGPMKCLKDADFSTISDDLKRAKDKKVVSVTVSDVQPVSVNVQWQWQTPSLSDLPADKNSVAPPPENILGDDLSKIKCLNIFESCTMQIGDISYYTPTSKDTIIDRNDWKKLKANICARSHQVVEKKSQAGLAGLLSGAAKKPDETDNKTVADKDDLDDEYETLESGATPESNNNKLSSIDSSKNSHPGKKLKLCTRSLRKKKLKKAVRQQPATEVVSEAQTVVETLYTQSVVDVIWQDGTQEEGVVSIDLYPIHHLDDHEFFPGDFVVLAESQDFRKYGVVQTMDHAGRVAYVKWFEAYSFTGEQKPSEVEVSEMSVYDLKDHPDFRFRPGTLVVRVANWQGQQYPAGQIMDNHPDGQVRVWWANGEITPCWPQDLFRLGDYDSDEGEIWDDDNNSDDGVEDEDDDVNSDSSWETETEEEPNDAADNSSERYETIGKLIERIQKSLVSTRELIVASSSITIASDSLVGLGPVAKLGGFDERGLTKKLLQIYKDCQYLDKIMGTKYFDVEDLKKWRKDNESSTAKSSKIFEHISRLFKGNRENSPASPAVSQPVTTEPLNLGEPATANPSGEKGTEEPNAPEMVLYELCSVILSKLVEAHTAYEKRFGSFKNEHISANMLLKDANKGIEALAECFGKQFFKRHLIKAGCSRLHHEITYRVVLSSIDESFHASSSGEKSSKKTSSTEGKEAVLTDDAGKGEQMEIDNPAVSEIPENTLKDKEDEGISTLLESSSLNLTESQNFSTVDCAPDTHRYRLTAFQPQNQRVFLKTVQKELALLQESLPEGIVVKGFEDRMDLYSVMIKGPEKTPYEDGLFLFDIHLPPTYCVEPPMVHYISFCTGKLNPNLYEEGKICLSLLGTWNGKGTEVWTSKSSLLQLLVSLQGLILCPEPYYNEAGYEKQKGTQQGAENSRIYNENVLIKLVQSMSRMTANPPPPWQKEIIQHVKTHGSRLITRCSKWLELSNIPDDAVELPGFPLLPVSKGFSITLKKSLASFGKLLDTVS